MGVGGFSTDVLVVPARGSTIGVRTNTIQGVSPKEVGDPLAALRRYSEKKSSPRTLRSSLPVSEWTAVSRFGIVSLW